MRNGDGGKRGGDDGAAPPNPGKGFGEDCGGIMAIVPSLAALIAAHPLQTKPYNAIKFCRTNRAGVALYRVTGDDREMAAKRALKTAFERYGAHCFHCRKWMPPQSLSHQCTRDHLHPKVAGGGDKLHNLVFACGNCNRAKGRADLIGFNVETGSAYMLALAQHVARCVDSIHHDPAIKPPALLPAAPAPALPGTGGRLPPM